LYTVETNALISECEPEKAVPPANSLLQAQRLACRPRVGWVIDPAASKGIILSINQARLTATLYIVSNVLFMSS